MTNFRNKQQGVVLMIALIALVAISLAGIALMRSVDTSNVVSGNIAFNEAAIQMADIGAEQAYLDINANANFIHPAYAALDANKLPTQATLNWQTIPANTANLPTGYTVRYVIERLCSNNANPATFANCRAVPVYDNPVAPALPAAMPNGGKLFYRITVEVNGPRNTRALSQFFYGVLDIVN